MLTLERIESTKIPEAQDLTLYELFLLRRASGGNRFEIACLAYKAGYLRGAGQAKKNAPASAGTLTEASPKSKTTSKKEQNDYDTVF